jgi:phospholipid-binding lipoprotein MlaA
MSMFNSQASIPRFKHLMEYSEKLVTYPNLFLLGVLAVLLLMLNTAQAATPNDPLEGINRPIMHFNTAVDTVLFKPWGKTYQQFMPRFAKKRVSNMFSNLDDIRVVASDLLKLKFGQALSDSGRLAINSTVGLAGLFNVAAAEFGLEKHDEDIGTALAHWNAPPGPYLVLPIVGPSTLRETLATTIEYQLDIYPLLSADNRQVADKLLIVSAAHSRARLLPIEDMIIGDKYIFVREMYLQNLNYRNGLDNPNVSFNNF